ncbi:hypothetical protein [Actinoplanes sp. NPDC020271]|uniref:hypothetical protein n=1 Tax=Actinoplanes sp. NPDC020271 TaxID=3363896 RepID=UPI0037A78FE5
MMRSAWIKWARAVEHQRVLARQSREFVEVDSHEYVRFDNANDDSDPLLRIQWRLHVKQPYPEQWSLLIGDILTNLRAALDHALWAAVIAHSGPPPRPQAIQFPIATTAKKLRQPRSELAELVTAEVWQAVESLQPLQAQSDQHLHPLEILRWLCNVDKHRFVHVVGRTSIDLTPVHIASPTPLEIIDEWRHEGPVADGAAVASLKIKRPADGRIRLDLQPTFSLLATLQISDDPIDHRSLRAVMDGIRDAVLWVLVTLTKASGQPVPDPGSLELGDFHETVAAQYAGHLGIVRHADGTLTPIPSPPEDNTPD